MKNLIPAAVTAALAAAASAAFAAPITPGDLVIYRVGNGTETLANTGNSVFLDEYTTAGALVQSIAVDNSTANALVSSGTATSEGLINATPDGQSFAVAGYNRAAVGTGSVVTTAAATVNRIVDVYNLTGTVQSTTKLSDFADKNNPRSALTTDGTTLFVGGAAGGVRTTTVGSTTSSQVNTTANVRDVNTDGTQVYFSTSSGTTGIYAVTGNAATPGQSATPIVATASPYAFVFADLSTAVAGVDTLYVADDSATGGGILKYALVNGVWTAEGSITAASVRGLTANVVNGVVSLYGTTGGSTATGGGTLYGFTDATGYAATVSGTATTLATAAANEAFRGVVFVPEPAGLAALAVGGLGVLRRRRA